ncbi:MAG: asparagine synthase (glutamine-hydrolyzing) [Candidatus Pacebacteria bacterium]|nr:asparagine synthase (glutamine-hydrolyzing) [Candidatus Paceibacterota bacterium]
MCGISGIISLNPQALVQNNTIIAMRDAMIHRGPDGGGLWLSDDRRVGFGHRRLSIIDLDDRANQPMANEDGQVMITFNGEIYNHRSLRQILVKAGHDFKTDHSDTEVLVHGYEEWGIEGLLERLSGDFAFAIWDNHAKKLVLARDRIGVKPLAFAWFDDRFLFASEIKAIVKYPNFKRAICPHAAYHYLSFMTTPAPMTMFEGVYKLPAGTYAEIDLGGNFTAKRYWDAVPGQGIDPSETKGLSAEAREEFYINGIRSRLESAVEKRMMSDVPFGVFLSGGVDSSTNVALMSRLMDRPVDSFTVGFKDYKHLNELDYAQSIATKFKTNHHEILIDEADMKGYLQNLIHSQDEPIADWVCIPLYFVSKLAHDSGVTVIQVGEGSDEQFSGYGSYMKYLELYHKYWQPYRKYMPQFGKEVVSYLAQVAAKVKPQHSIYADIIERASHDRDLFWSGATVFWDSMKNQVLNQSKSYRSNIRPEIIDSGLMPVSYLQTNSHNIIAGLKSDFKSAAGDTDFLTQMIYNEFKLRLPELLLMRVDKISMSESLEARVPFLDHDLVQFTMDIPEQYKIKNNVPKYLLKKAVEGIIPDDIIYRKKMGFGAPMGDWLKTDFGHWMQDSVLNSKLMKQDFFNKNLVEYLFETHRSGKYDTSVYCWTLFNLTSWYDYWIES